MKQRPQSWEIRENRPTAEGHLDPHGRGETAERAEECCRVTRYPSGGRRSAFRAPPAARWEGELTRGSEGEPRHRTACPANLLWQKQSGRAQGSKFRSRVDFMAQIPTSATLGDILCTEEKAVGLKEKQ